MTRKEEIYNAARKSDAPFYFQEGANWADEHPHWISVDEELPPYGEVVLLYCDTWDIPHVCERVEECGGDVYYNDEGRMLEDKPSYWMPRPKLPKKGGEK
jgi:hypothetical protein